jgi:excisionase family DNA binding protein
MTRPHGSSTWAGKEIFSTGEAARACGISQQTIIRCFDDGRIEGFRVPGSRFRRIPRGELLLFMRRNDIPTNALESTTKRVLLVDDDPAVMEAVTDLLGAQPGIIVRSASNGYDAGLLTEQFRPHLIVLDPRLPDIDGRLVCRRVKTSPALRGARVVIISRTASSVEIRKLAGHGADAFVQKPFDLATLFEVVRRQLQMVAAGEPGRAPPEDS